MSNKSKTREAYSKLASEYSVRNYDPLWSINELEIFQSLLKGNKIAKIYTYKKHPLKESVFW